MTTPQHPHPPTPTTSVSTAGRASPLRRWAGLVLSLLLGSAGLAALAGPVAAATVYEIEGSWINAPATVSRGNPVVAEWRINVNDDQPAPSNDPVENVTATFTLQKAFFDEIPDMCLTTGVTPASTISADGTELTCNFGTVDQGTALVLQTPVVANGVTGEEVVMDGTSPSGETVDLPPIPIRNPFVMDMHWVGTTPYEKWDDIDNPTYVDVDLEWSLRLGKGSDPGPNTVTQRLTVVDSNGRPVVRGVHPDIGQPDNQGVPGCTEFDMSQADGHPWSHAPGHPRSTSFVDSCTLTPVAGQPGVFDLTLTGINYDLLNVPRLDSYGNPLPPNWNTVASGMVWFRVLTSQAGSINLRANAPTYTAPTGQQYTDLAGNNVSNKVYTLPGGFSAAYLRSYTGNGGTQWDDTYRVAAGTTVWAYVHNAFAADSATATARYGVCEVLDTQFVDFDPTVPMEFWVSNTSGGARKLDGPPVGAVVEYHTAGVGDPNAFNCGTGTWSTTPPANPAAVSAVRMTYPFSSYAAEDALGIQIRVPTRIQANAPIGQDIWSFGSYLRNGTWPPPANMGNPLTSTPDYRYPNTNGRRDVLVVVLATPFIEKDAAGSTVTPGVPAEFTLTYSANGSGTIPPTVDGYTIRDVLPLGMTYVTGSAAPEPVLTTDAQGRQVLTWTLDDVATNTEHPLVYEAVADDSIAPGTQLTNTAVSSLAGESSAPVTETVTTSTNGYTVISKTADTPYIPNLDGSGDGEGIWTVTMRSFDPLPQAYTDVIDILPYEGDFRGTDYEGSYQLAEVSFPAGSSGTVYYTTAHPATLSDDPAAPVNGGANSPSALWSTTFTPAATAVRVIGGVLAPGAARQFRVHIQTEGAEPLDLFVNRAQGRAQHTRLAMRTSEPMSVAHYYAANLKKYVQDAKGNWHDAQDVTDYPAFRYGDTVRYRIVVTNIGQGTITNLDVSDDQQPALGNFHVDSLAPGEQESHEFELELTPATNGTVVNTACGEADIPEDSQVPPTINCDPAGFEVANYTTVKSSVPKPGSAVQVGERIRYTVTVTQQGTAPAEAEFSDDLAKVLDDAKYNRDVKASLGTATYQRGHIVWNGTIPVGGVAKVTYSVTVKSVNKLGNRRLVNPVTSPGCAVRDGETISCRTEHRVPRFDLSLDKRVAGPTRVPVGGAVRYRLRVSNNGPDVAPGPIRLVDKLPNGLELRSARGRGWDCKVDKARDKVVCKRDRDLDADRSAAPVFVVAKATKAALGRRLVNIARVSAGGDLVRSNNRDAAKVNVRRVRPPSTGFRVPLLRGWF